MNDPPGTELFTEGLAVGQHHIAGVVLVLGLFFGIEVVEIAEKLVEAVIGGQVLVAVTEMVLAELAGGVALVLQKHGDRGVLDVDAFFGTGKPDLREPGAEHTLAQHERSAACGAGLLAVIVSKEDALPGNAVDVGRPVADQTACVSTDVRLADVIAPDD